MADADLNDPTSASVMQRLYAIEAERGCRELLACYGFYADYGLNKEWVELFTEDGVMEFSFYDDTQYYDDTLWPGVADPRTVKFPLLVDESEHRRLPSDLALSPAHDALVARCRDARVELLGPHEAKASAARWPRR